MKNKFPHRWTCFFYLALPSPCVIYLEHYLHLNASLARFYLKSVNTVFHLEVFSNIFNSSSDLSLNNSCRTWAFRQIAFIDHQFWTFGVGPTLIALYVLTRAIWKDHLSVSTAVLWGLGFFWGVYLPLLLTRNGAWQHRGLCASIWGSISFPGHSVCKLNKSFCHEAAAKLWH